MFTFKFGDSFTEGRPVSEVIQRAAPRTLFLFVGAVLIEYGLGVSIGRYIAWRRRRFIEGATILPSLFFRNMPSFWIGLILLWLFAFLTGWFPLRGFSDPTWTAAHVTLVAGLSPDDFRFEVVDIGMHAVLPMAALVLINASGSILLMQTSMLEVLGEDFILTARAKGLPERIVRRRHAARNAYLPVVTSLTISLAFAIGGAIILERIFSYFGMGYYFLQAIIDHDQFLAGALLFIISVLVIFGNIIADILYGVLDPRVRI
jgi:peptide/nickel transport system permease protein